MTVGSEYIITYKDLVDYAVNKIKASCHNIDAFHISVPAQYKNGSVVTKASKYWSRTTQNGNTHRSEHTSTINATTSDGALAVVPLATVTSQLNEFMQSRGLLTKEDTVMSFKTIINFFNNLSAFMSVKLWHVYSPVQGTRGIIFYNSGAVTYPAVSTNIYTPVHTGNKMIYHKPVEPYNPEQPEYEEVEVDEVQAPTDEEAEITIDNLQTTVDSFISNMNNVSNVHQALITLAYACSSCSSSSSSSSSSCSSSSSSFIVYMDI